MKIQGTLFMPQFGFYDMKPQIDTFSGGILQT
jgi:hypothetical protein